MSTTAIRPNSTASPAYVPRSFRPTSPYPASSSTQPPASSSNHNLSAASTNGSIPAARSHSHSGSLASPRSNSASRMEHPLPSRPTTPMPPNQTPRLSADRIAASPIQPSNSSNGASSSAMSGSTNGQYDRGELHHSMHGNNGDRKGSSLRNEVNLGGSGASSPRSKGGKAGASRRSSFEGNRSALSGGTSWGGVKGADKEGEVGEVEDGEVREVSEETKKHAREILKIFRIAAVGNHLHYLAKSANPLLTIQLLSNLPAPLPEQLPPTFLPTPRTTPTTSPTSFAAYARALLSASPPNAPHPLGQSIGKRRRSSSPNPAGVGLGLGLVDLPHKRTRPSTLSLSASAAYSGASGAPAHNATVMTPSASQVSFGVKLSPELRRVSSLGQSAPSGSTRGENRSVTPLLSKREISRGAEDRASLSPRDGKELWSRAKWAEAAAGYKSRALLRKRHGDAHLRLAGAKPQFLHLPADTLLGLVALTDAVLLWLYSYWCDEQAEGRVRGTPYRDSQALRDYVRGEWERWVRKGASDYQVDEESRESLREMGKGMIGLMYLIEAVIHYHLSTEQLTHLNRRSTQINALASSTSSNPTAGTGTQNASGTGINNPSPSNSGASPSNNSQHGPSPHSSAGAQSSSAPSNSSPTEQIPAEITALISTSTSQSARAAQNLLAARHHLPLSLLRQRFPASYDNAINSELSDESLPAPNDVLGAARKVDIDETEHFVWPIEFGMCAPVAHLAVFGRGLVREVADTAGKEWDVSGPI